MSVQQEKFKEIADAIRAKTNSADKIKPSEFADKINDVYDAGKQAEYDAFWDSYQNYGNRTYYRYAFAGIGWNDTTFKPKYDIKPQGDNPNLFRENHIHNLKNILLSCGVVLDLSSCTGDCQYMFAYGVLRILPKLDFSSAQKLNYTFTRAEALREIDEIVVHENLTYSYPFNLCTSLTKLIVSGTIGQNGFNVSACPLNHDSLMSIINHLKNGVSGLTVTLGSTNLAKLTDAEKAIATQKGWTLA